MSLFVGNISKYVKTFELEDEFKQFGHCEIKRNVSNVSATMTARLNVYHMTLSLKFAYFVFL